MQSGEKDSQDGLQGVKVSLTRDVKGHKIVRRGNRLYLPLGNPLILGPHETQLVIPPFQVFGKGVQNIAGSGQILGVLTLISWRKSGEFKVQLNNKIEESKLLSQKLSVVVIVASPDSIVEIDKSVRKQVSAQVNSILLEKWIAKYPGLFEDKGNYGDSEFLNKTRVTHKEVDWKVHVEDIHMNTYGVTYYVGEVTQEELETLVKKIRITRSYF